MDDFAPNFKWVDGKVTVTTAEYNRLNAEHGNTWNWCQAYGLQLRDAVQNDDGTVTVFCDQVLQVTQEPASAPTPADPPDPPAPSPTGDLADN